MSRQYVTTAIDYPNAAPHMGHVLEKVLADVAARWFRLRGDEVRFQIGTDEHGIKIQRTAEKEGITPQALVDRNVPLFEDLYSRLNISYDVFIRTTDQKRHWPTVEALWKKLQEAGVLEKRAYTGLYCSGCERFLTKRDLVDGVCPIHKTKPEEVTEENWFLLMKREGDWLKALLTKGIDGQHYEIVPSQRANETLALLEQGLEDVSFSRPTSSLAWGIPVPGDEGQTMYVWCDALTNYISGLGFFTKKDESEWWNDGTVTHVIGKDIARFHALIWPTMLKAAEVKIPDRLLIHGFLTSEGEKMSKSLGNVVVPQDVIEKYGVDPLRFYLSHEVPVGNDGDFSWERFASLYDSSLRNKLGNLLNRVLVLLGKEGGVVAVPESATDAERAKEGWETYQKKLDAFDVHAAISQAMDLVEALNAGIDSTKPWEKTGEEKLVLLSRFAESLRFVALLLLPFVPETAQRISQQLGVPYADAMLDRDFMLTDEIKDWGGQKTWKKIGTPEILFKPVE